MTNHPFVITPHFRLQEWVAEEKGYFTDEGLDYVFDEAIQASDGGAHDTGAQKAGAYQTFEEGRTSDVSCACHWTVNVAAANQHGKLWADLYSVAPAGIFVPQSSAIKSPEDLADIPISVGFQSGSHYATIQALEQYLPAERINLSFSEGMLFKRLDNMLDGTSAASFLFNGPYYLAEQLGYRKLIDASFMIATMITAEPLEDDLQKFYRALKRAQKDIDLRPELYTHYYKREFPVRYHELMDTRRWGPGERIVFESYSAEAFSQARNWIADRGIFEGGEHALGDMQYADAVIKVVAA